MFSNVIFDDGTSLAKPAKNFNVRIFCALKKVFYLRHLSLLVTVRIPTDFILSIPLLAMHS